MTSTETLNRPTVGDTLSCGHVLTDAMRHSAGTWNVEPFHPIGTGYARTQDDRTLCYPCADASERETMLVSDTLVAYVDSAGNLTTWTGGLLAHKRWGYLTRSGFGYRPSVHVWRFRAPDGSEWFGRNAGPGMVIRVRRAKHSTH